MAAKKKKAKATKPSAVKKSRKITAKASSKSKRTSAKRAPLSKRPKAKPAVKAAPKKKASPKRPAAAKPKSKPKPKAKVLAKAAPKAKPVAKSAPKAKPIQRRDGAGHLDPKYAADLRARIQPHEDETTAFLGEGRSSSSDDLAEELAEEAVETMTSGEYEAEDALNQSVPEDRGGPFVPSTAGAEFASEDEDESNPQGATREPFPTT